MKEKRSYKINGRIFALPDIKKLAEIFKEEHKCVVKKKNHSSLTFSVKCEDGSEYETEDTKLFDGNKINTKRISDIEFYFVDYKEDKRLQFHLTNGNYSYGNELIVSGDDSNWVNGCLVKLKEIIEACPSQLNFVNRFGFLLLLIFSISVGMILLFILVSIPRFLLFKPFISPIKLIYDEPQIFLVLVFIIGSFPSFYIVEYLKKMFPNIEIQIGPSHTFFEANRRKILYTIIIFALTSLLVPLLIK